MLPLLSPAPNLSTRIDTLEHELRSLSACAVEDSQISRRELTDLQVGMVSELEKRLWHLLDRVAELERGNSDLTTRVSVLEGINADLTTKVQFLEHRYGYGTVGQIRSWNAQTVANRSTDIYTPNSGHSNTPQSAPLNSVPILSTPPQMAPQSVEPLAGMDYSTGNPLTIATTHDLTMAGPAQMPLSSTDVSVANVDLANDALMNSAGLA